MELNLGRVAFLDRDVYSPTVSYNKWDFVTTVDSCYLYINTEPSIGQPITNTAYWKCIADGKPSTLAAAAAAAVTEQSEAFRDQAEGFKNETSGLKDTVQGLHDTVVLDAEQTALDRIATGQNAAAALQSKNYASGYADAALLSEQNADQSEAAALQAKIDAEAARDASIAKVGAEVVQMSGQDINNVMSQKGVTDDVSAIQLHKKYYSFNGTSSKKVIGTTYSLDADGDYVEMRIRTKGAYTANQYQHMGILGMAEYNNLIGVHPTRGFTVRQGNGAWIYSNAQNASLLDWNTLKVSVSGGNYVLQINGYTVATGAKAAKIDFNNIGNGYIGWFANVDIEYIDIATASGNLYIDNVTGGVDVTEVLYTYPKNQTSDILYSFDKKDFCVYQRIKENLYNKITICHDYDLSDMMYIDYWRIKKGELYEWIDGLFLKKNITINNILDGSGNPATITTSRLIAEGESEFTMKQTGKSDHTGGWHGDEILSFVEFFADGIRLDIANVINLTEGKEFTYIEKSTLHETSTDGINPIAGHPIVATHYKITEIFANGYKTNNRVVFNGAINIDKFYCGVFGPSRLLTRYAYTEKLDKLYDFNTETEQIGGVSISEFHAHNYLSIFANSKLLKGGKTETMFSSDNAQPLTYKKYYNYVSGTTLLNEEWEAEMNVIFV